MQLVLVSILILFGGGALSAIGGSRLPRPVGPVSCVLGSLLALVPVADALVRGRVLAFRHEWAVPGGSFYLHIDALSAFFLIPILGLSALGACYGAEYMRGKERRSHWLFYNLLVAGMVVVVSAWNGVLFLVAWEVMAIASFFLVTNDDEKESVRSAGWTYLVATHLGTAFLFGMFALLGREAGSLDFDRIGNMAGLAGGTAAVIFIFALIGFGTKAGLVPFHVWLPEAHPAAPSHVSAIMSGVMIKTGIYGIVRTLTFLGVFQAWWGWTLLGAGLVSALYGVLFALAQRDLKRMLAYSSVENIGIIVMGLGVGVLGLSAGSVCVASLAFAGALLHVFNHSIMKGLLFLGAGSLLHSVGTGDMERLGGLSKRMPGTAIAFAIGAAAIVGLPPLNGFTGEFLVFLSSFRGAGLSRLDAAVPSLVAIAGLATVSGLAAACFARAFGSAFLGEPKSSCAGLAHDPRGPMRLAQWVLAALCVLMGFIGPVVLRIAAPAVLVATGLSATDRSEGLADASAGLVGVSCICAAFVCLFLALASLRRRLLARRTVGQAVTWDCGYAAPTPRMQYTASSFAQPLTALFRAVLGAAHAVERPSGLFPASGLLHTETPDVFRKRAYRPLFERTGELLLKARRVQHGNLHLYVLYMAATLLVLLVWELW